MKNATFTAIVSAIALSASLAAAQTITPTRVGPVSQYGQLMTGKNSQGKGRIYGSCEGVKDGAEVQVRGMSLYWSLMDEALEFWSEEGVTSMVNDMKIQIVRAAMATGTEDWTKGKYVGYQVQPDAQTNFMKTVVEAAIKQDIYVIIDWHSHEANTQTQNAVKFFGEMAQKYGSYDNVIFEVFNEPKKVEWNVIKTYADAVVAEIRKYSDNLILVGTPEWDQYPNRAIGGEVSDPKNNTAYTFHYYSGTHCISGMHPGNQYWACEGDHAMEAMDAGLSVFVSEWGTTTSDGQGGVAGDNDGWQNWMNENKLSWANWSASKIPEGSAAFSDGATKTSLQFTTSGNQVKGYLSSNAASYTKCPTGDNQQGQQGDGQQGQGQQGHGTASFLASPDFGLSVSFAGKSLRISAPQAATVEIFNTLGNKIVAVDHVRGELSLAMLPTGQYMVRVRSGSASTMRAIAIK